MSKLFTPRNLPGSVSFGLLAVRLSMGIAFIMHGWPKMQNLTTWGADFGYPEWAQAAAALAEFGGGIFLALGLLTPLAALGLGATMAVALQFHIGSDHPFVAGKPPSWELAAIYMACSILILFSGPGRLSADAKLFPAKS